MIFLFAIGYSGRYAQLGEITGLVGFLAYNPAASYIIGQVLEYRASNLIDFGSLRFTGSFRLNWMISTTYFYKGRSLISPMLIFGRTISHKTVIPFLLLW